MAALKKANQEILWDFRYHKLVAYQAQHGHCRYSEKKGPLGRFVRMLRYQFRDLETMKNKNNNKNNKRDDDGGDKNKENKNDDLGSDNEEQDVEKGDDDDYDGGETRKAATSDQPLWKNVPGQELTEERIELLNKIGFQGDIRRHTKVPWYVVIDGDQSFV